MCIKRLPRRELLRLRQLVTAEVTWARLLLLRLLLRHRQEVTQLIKQWRGQRLVGAFLRR
jgi:hypothetical protein